MQRREFVRWMTVGAIASSLPVAIVACGNPAEKTPVASTSPLPLPTNSASGSAAGSIAELDKAGFLNVAVDGQPTVLVRDPNNKNDIIAVNAKCTHKGCTVAWKADQKALVCPCHDATFDATGKVTKGPADQPLKRHVVKLEGDKIIVQA
jgi:cytochrome b6-f complex iron-sulfur subunit